MWFRSQQQSEQRIAALVVTALSPQLGRMESALNALLGEVKTMGTVSVNLQQALTDLQNQVQENTSAEKSAATVMVGIAAQLQQLLNPPTPTTDAATISAIEGYVAQLKASVDPLAAAIVASTPQATPPATGTTA